MDHEDEWGYFHTFLMVFDRVEKDMGFRISFDHLIKSDVDSPTGI
jgi:hypothetical protein